MSNDGDDDRVPWRELQRRALLQGIPATLPRDELEARLGIRSNESVRSNEDDADEPKLLPDGSGATAHRPPTREATDHLADARDHIREALDELDERDGSIRVADGIRVEARGETVRLQVDGREHEFDREFATLLGMCVYVAAAW
jgi:hypothetical protein